jgi:hypothetical protein
VTPVVTHALPLSSVPLITIMKMEFATDVQSVAVLVQMRPTVTLVMLAWFWSRGLINTHRLANVWMDSLVFNRMLTLSPVECVMIVVRHVQIPVFTVPAVLLLCSSLITCVFQIVRPQSQTLTVTQQLEHVRLVQIIALLVLIYWLVLIVLMQLIPRHPFITSKGCVLALVLRILLLMCLILNVINVQIIVLLVIQWLQTALVVMTITVSTTMMVQSPVPVLQPVPQVGTVSQKSANVVTPLAQSVQLSTTVLLVHLTMWLFPTICTTSLTFSAELVVQTSFTQMQLIQTICSVGVAPLDAWHALLPLFVLHVLLTTIWEQLQWLTLCVFFQPTARMDTMLIQWLKHVLPVRPTVKHVPLLQTANNVSFPTCLIQLHKLV